MGLRHGMELRFSTLLAPRSIHKMFSRLLYTYMLQLCGGLYLEPPILYAIIWSMYVWALYTEYICTCRTTRALFTVQHGCSYCMCYIYVSQGMWGVHMYVHRAIIPNSPPPSYHPSIIHPPIYSTNYPCTYIHTSIHTYIHSLQCTIDWWTPYFHYPPNPRVAI